MISQSTGFSLHKKEKPQKYLDFTFSLQLLTVCVHIIKIYELNAFKLTGNKSDLRNVVQFSDAIVIRNGILRLFKEMMRWQEILRTKHFVRSLESDTKLVRRQVEKEVNDFNLRQLLFR
jgi:hypothetical protein